MPRMDNATALASTLIKLLLIADGKAGKSHFAAAAANAGFNLVYIDGDVASTTISGMTQTQEGKPPVLTKEAASRIYLMPARDTILGGSKDHRFCDLITEFTTTITFKWNDTQGRVASMADMKANVDEIWQIFPAKMGPDVILVIDSWTSLTESIMLKCAIANGVNLTDTNTNEMRAVWQSAANITTAMLQTIRSMPCHVIVLGHPDQYEHKIAPDGRKVSEVKEKDLIIEWTKMIAKSTSRPQALQMPKYFTDVAWLEVSPTGDRKLDFRAKASRIGGGHFSGFENTEKYSFANLVKTVGGAIPDGKQPTDWLKILTPEEVGTLPESKVLQGGETGKVGIAGFAGLKKA